MMQSTVSRNVYYFPLSISCSFRLRMLTLRLMTCNWCFHTHTLSFALVHCIYTRIEVCQGRSLKILRPPPPAINLLPTPMQQKVSCYIIFSKLCGFEVSTISLYIVQKFVSKFCRICRATSADQSLQMDPYNSSYCEECLFVIFRSIFT